MCLSTAYRDSNPEEVLMEYVSAVNIDGENHYPHRPDGTKEDLQRKS